MDNIRPQMRDLLLQMRKEQFEHIVTKLVVWSILTWLIWVTPALSFSTYPFKYAYTEISWLFRGRPAIPQFILDMKHPWLEDRANMLYIKILPKPKEAFCNLNSPLRPPGSDSVNKQYPSSFFSKLVICNHRYGINRPGWKNAQARLQEILDCPAALADVESLKVDIWISDGRYGFGYPESSRPPKNLPELFVTVLAKMPRLRSLDWGTHDNGNKEFGETFMASNLKLPTLTRLRTAIYTEWWVNLCPNIQSLESGDSESTADYWRWTSKDIDGRELLINSTEKLSDLTSFRMFGEWEIKHVKALLEKAPQLIELKLHGDIGYRYYNDIDDEVVSDDDSTEEGQPEIVDDTSAEFSIDPRTGRCLLPWLEVIANFKSLQTLHLSSAFEIGFNPVGGPRCGNPYMGPNGRAMGREELRDKIKRNEEAGRFVITALPHIKQLGIEYSIAQVSDLPNGKKDLKWPWTNRIEEYVYSIWPEKKVHDEL